MAKNIRWICALAVAAAIPGCSAERWAERDAQVRCERLLVEALAEMLDEVPAGSGDVGMPEPRVEAVGGDDGHLVTWHALRIPASAGVPAREATARCRFGLQGDVEWIELDGERIYDPATRNDAVQAQRDEAAAGADADTVR